MQAQIPTWDLRRVGERYTFPLSRMGRTLQNPMEDVRVRASLPLSAEGSEWSAAWDDLTIEVLWGQIDAMPEGMKFSFLLPDSESVEPVFHSEKLNIH